MSVCQEICQEAGNLWKQLMTLFSLQSASISTKQNYVDDVKETRQSIEEKAMQWFHAVKHAIEHMTNRVGLPSIWIQKRDTSIK